LMGCAGERKRYCKLMSRPKPPGGRHMDVVIPMSRPVRALRKMSAMT
jgi:hypothetical protein